MPINYEKGVLPENYIPNTYESLGNMIGKIAEQKITTVDATNKLAIFSKKLPMNGDTIEQVVIKLSNVKPRCNKSPPIKIFCVNNCGFA